MSLVTIQRSPSPTSDVQDSAEQSDEFISSNNLSEDYFASKATVILQNQGGRRRSSIIKEGDTLQFSLIKIVELLRKEDSMKLMVNLEKVNLKNDDNRYFCLISRNSTDEYLILGVDVSTGRATIGFVQPICQDMSVKLDGDGGFKVKFKDGEKLFKPTSVHALWSTVQKLNKTCSIARHKNYYGVGSNSAWIKHYSDMIKSNRAQIAEWNRMLDADTIVNSNMAPQSAIGEYVMGTEMDEQRQNQELIRKYLEEIMREEDMDNVTVTFLREKLQENVKFNVNDYRRFIAEEILIIYGKMDEASNILPHLYLGSTYNASNLEELLKNGIIHIINVTRECENFFRDRFVYKNVEVYDVEDTKLMKHFDSCYKFINEAKMKNGACLVHCQRGISRSASIVISYMMKEFNLSFEDALDAVKKKRDCIKPNDGFLQQLKTYEGILKASSHRHNEKFGKKNVPKRFSGDIYQRADRDSVLDTYNQLTNKPRSDSDICELHQTNASDLTNSLTNESFSIKSDDDALFIQNMDTNEDVLLCKDMDEFKPINTVTNIKSDTRLSLSIDKPADFPEFKETCRSTQCLQNTWIENDNIERTFPIDLNANISPEETQSEFLMTEKKALKIKSDHSWIKSSNCNEGEYPIEENIAPSNSNRNSMNRTPDANNEHTQSMSEVFESSDTQLPLEDIDFQSLRPVKELLDIYKKK